MIEVNQEQFAQVVQRAFDATQHHRLWQMAIIRARQIVETNPFVELMDDGTLLMLSESNQIYEHITDAFSPCTAFGKGQPCKHRALYRLIQRYGETSH